MVQSAAAVDYPVSGTISINGSTGSLPDGSFEGSSYDPTAGSIGAGAFKFAEATVTQGSYSLTYELGQVDTSTGQVDVHGAASLSNAAMSLRLIKGVTPFGPANFGQSCIFSPINLLLSGTASANGLALSSPAFTVLPTTDDCNGWASLLNAQMSGSTNTIALNVDGNFTPPGVIFIDGFDSAR